MNHTQTTAILKALADPTRLRLVNILAGQELNVGELVTILAMNQSRISRHLKILAGNGILSSRREGHWVFYAAVDRGVAARIINLLIQMNGDDPVLGADARAAAQMINGRVTATRRFFDRIALDWDRRKKKLLGGVCLEEIAARSMPPVRVAVDLGCGTGELLATMAGKAEQVIGVDGSRKMLAVAARRFARDASRVSLRLGRLEHLPLDDGEAGLAVASLSLHHLTRPMAGIKQGFRVLAPGGWFYVMDFARHQKESLRREFGDQWLGFDPEQLQDWLTRAGFGIEAEEVFPLAQGLELLFYRCRRPLALSNYQTISTNRVPSGSAHNGGA